MWMRKTPGFEDLDDLADPVSTIQALLESGDSMTCQLFDQPTKKTVMDELQKCTVAHFVCHAESNVEEPSESCIYLQSSDLNTPDRLTLYDLEKQPSTDASLLYLSACSTAENRSIEFIDETIHIAAGFQLLGFPRVVATLWEADGEAANTITKSFYKSMAKRKGLAAVGLDLGADVAYSLHDAIMELILGNGMLSTSGRRKRNVAENVIAWAPFVYFGC